MVSGLRKLNSRDMGHDQVLRIIAAQVRRRRQALGLSQEEFAERCGLHRTYVGAIERAERNITIKAVVALANALGCSPEELLEGSR